MRVLVLCVIIHSRCPIIERGRVLKRRQSKTSFTFPIDREEITPFAYLTQVFTIHSIICVRVNGMYVHANECVRATTWRLQIWMDGGTKT